MKNFAMLLCGFLFFKPFGSVVFAQTFTHASLWKPLDLSNAMDQGHVARELTGAEISPAGAITLVDRTDSAGLSTAVGGGNDHGVGIGFVDLDGDTFADIFIANGFNNRGAGQFQPQFFRNKGNGTFEDVSVSSGIRSILNNADLASVAAADYDNDGDIDLYLGGHPHDILLKNNGNGTFVDETSAANTGGPASSSSAASDGRSKIVAFGDYDGDGNLDIVSASSAFVNWSRKAYLLRNKGDGTFEDVTIQTNAKAGSAGNPCAVMWSDIDNDADQDLWIWNDRGSISSNRILLRNNSGTNFTDISNQINTTMAHPMGIDAADIDRNGYLDYYMSNAGFRNRLLQNSGNATFTNIASASGTAGDFGWGLGFEDFNLDSWYDIFVAQEDNKVYQVFKHNGVVPPTFQLLTFSHPSVVNSGWAHNVPVGFADYDHDGRVDVAVVNTDGTRLLLYRNETNVGSHHWLEVAVDRAPRSLERGGISARVVIKTGAVIQFKDITAGSSRASQNELSVRFGLANWTGAEWVGVLWPDGRQLVVKGVAGNQTIRLSAAGVQPVQPAPPTNLRIIP